MNTQPASDADFPGVYHKLIHSPALETLLQLEHTYAMAVADVCKGWDNARSVLQERYHIHIIVRRMSQVLPNRFSTSYTGLCIEQLKPCIMNRPTNGCHSCGLHR